MQKQLLPPPVKKKYSPEHMMLRFYYYFLKTSPDHGYPDTARPNHRSVFRHGEQSVSKIFMTKFFQMEKEEIVSV